VVKVVCISIVWALSSKGRLKWSKSDVQRAESGRGDLGKGAYCSQAGDLWERCKLPWRGSGQAVKPPKVSFGAFWDFRDHRFLTASHCCFTRLSFA